MYQAAVQLSELGDAEREAIDARNQLVLKNRGLIQPVLSKIRGLAPQDRDDAFQVGVLALMKAAERYDPAKARLSTYACFLIRRAVLLWLKTRTSVVHTPYWPNVPARWKSKLERARQPYTRLVHEPPGGRDTTAIADDDEERDFRRQTVRRLLPLLCQREQDAVRARYIDRMTHREIGLLLGTCKERARQIIENALENLRLLAGVTG